MDHRIFIAPCAFLYREGRDRRYDVLEEVDLRLTSWEDDRGYSEAFFPSEMSLLATFKQTASCRDLSSAVAERIVDPEMSREELHLEGMVDNCWLVRSPATDTEKIVGFNEDLVDWGGALSFTRDYHDDPGASRRNFQLLGEAVASRLTPVGAQGVANV